MIDMPRADNGNPDDNNNPGQPRRCGAKNRQGQPCQRWAMANGRCSFHGGKSLKGVASPAFKHGRHSKYFLDALPPSMRGQFEAAMANEDLLSVRQYVALTDAKVMEAMKRFRALDSPDFRGRLVELWEEFKQLQSLPSTTDEERQAKAVKIKNVLDAIDKIVEGGAAEWEAWEQVTAAINDRLRCTQVEAKRLLDNEQMITVEQAMAIVVTLHDILNARLKDPNLLSLIARDLEVRLGLTAAIDCDT